MMFPVSPGHYIVLAALMFGIGVLGVLVRRNAIAILMSVELMLNAANLVFVAYAKQFSDPSGQAIAFFIMAIAAAEAAVGLAIFIGIFRTRQTLNVDELDALRDDP